MPSVALTPLADSVRLDLAALEQCFLAHANAFENACEGARGR
jgi:hypothetical protein